MSTDSAAAYADELYDEIREDAENGTPFGISDGCGDTPEGEPNTAMDYLTDVLDIEYVVKGDLTYLGARILIGYGGPNVWIDTRAGVLEVAWWSAPEIRPLPGTFVAELNDALEELWECSR